MIGTIHWILVVTVALTSTWAMAVSKQELQDRPAALTSKGTHRRLARAHGMMSKNNLDGAAQVLNKLKVSTAERPFEQAQVLQTLGFVYAQKEKFSLAEKVLKESLGLNVLPYSPTLSTMYTLVQMQIAQEKYGEAEKTLNLWFRLVDEPTAGSYVLMASIMAQKKKNLKALELVTKAIDMSPEPKESWLSFAVAMNYELSRFPEAARLLVKLTGMFPDKKKYWKQLSGVYLSLNRNDMALATFELARKAGFLDQEAEIMNLVSLNLYGGIPLNCAKLLEGALAKKMVTANQKHYEILGDCWAQAEEMDKALKAYEKSGKFSKDGRIFAKQGRIYLEQENWKSAEKYLTQGLAKGNLKKPEHILMAQGISRFNLKNFPKAIRSFEQAKAKSKKLLNQANQWIEYVNTEVARLNPPSPEKDPDQITQ